MTYEKNVKVCNHGMVSIPAALRAKYNIRDGDHVAFFEDEDGMKIIPIVSIEELRKKSSTVEEMIKIMRESRKEDLESDR